VSIVPNIVLMDPLLYIYLFSFSESVIYLAIYCPYGSSTVHIFCLLLFTNVLIIFRIGFCHDRRRLSIICFPLLITNGLIIFRIGFCHDIRRNMNSISTLFSIENSISTYSQWYCCGWWRHQTETSLRMSCKDWLHR